MHFVLDSQTQFRISFPQISRQLNSFPLFSDFGIVIVDCPIGRVTLLFSANMHSGFSLIGNRIGSIKLMSAECWAGSGWLWLGRLFGVVNNRIRSNCGLITLEKHGQCPDVITSQL